MTARLEQLENQLLSKKTSLTEVMENKLYPECPVMVLHLIEPPPREICIFVEMSVSSANGTVVIQYRDSFSKAVAKNVIVVVIGISINYINVGLIHTFCKHQIFYTNPRYVLFIHLVINDMIQVTLSLCMFIISYTIYKINASVCCTFILMALIMTENTPLNLACMALECYIAICFPLRHAQICTIKRMLILIGLIWTTTMLSCLPDLFITLATVPLDFFQSKIFCLRKTTFPNPIILEKRNITYIFQEMNTSSANVTVVLQYRDPISKAVAKNLIVVVIGISINYINAGLIHTFCKHQVEFPLTFSH
ncbi:hypothetical protein NQZ68_024566 [Dissostichus eleginoides]|nr:hypothetical protein NQZ68_024566 [Dissostichus eleginoides]